LTQIIPAKQKCEYHLHEMTNQLTKLPKRTFDYTQIEDSNDRNIVKSSVENYRKQWEKLRIKADKLVHDDHIAKAQCVLMIKTVVAPGLFISVCREELGLSESLAYNYASIGQKLKDSGIRPELKEILQQMKSAKAMNQLLNKSTEEQKVYIQEYQDSGRVPTQYQLREESKSLVREPEAQAVRETLINTAKGEKNINDRLKLVDLTPVEVLCFVGREMLRGREPSSSLKETIQQLNRLLMAKYR